MAQRWQEPERLTLEEWRRYNRTRLVQETGWTYAYVDSLSEQDVIDYWAVRKARNEMAKAQQEEAAQRARALRKSRRLR